MEDDFLRIGSGETPKIPWSEAVQTPTGSSTAPGPPFPSYSNYSQSATKRQKPSRKLALQLESVDPTHRAVISNGTNSNDAGKSGGESESPLGEMSSLASLRAAAASGNADAWDPMSFDYTSPEFNSYTSGPGVLMQSVNTDGSNENKNICLFVDHIPNAITKEGLRNLFSKAGAVQRVNIVKPKPGANSSYGFVEYSTVREAESAMQQFNNLDMGHGNHLIVKVSTSSKDRQKRLEQQKERDSFLKTLNCVKKSGKSTGFFETEDFELNKEESEKCEENPLVPRYIPHPSFSPEKPSTAISGSLSPTKTVLTSSDGAASLRAPSSFISPRMGGDGHSPPSKERTTRATSSSSGSGKGVAKEQPCLVCQTPTITKCSRCKTPYCSAVCQRKDWPVHKSVCEQHRRSSVPAAATSAASPPDVPKQPSEPPTEFKIAEDLDDDGFHISSYDDEEELRSLQMLLRDARSGKEPLELKAPSAFTAVKPPQEETPPQHDTNETHTNAEVETLFGLDASPVIPSATKQQENLEPLVPPSSFEETYTVWGSEIILSLDSITSQLYNTSESLMSVPLHSPLPQKFTAIVTTIKSCVRFSGVVASVEVKQALKQLKDYGASTTCTYLEASELTPGSKCGYKNERGEFIRVIVKSVHDDSSVIVTRYDFGGEYKLLASDLFRLPDEIIAIPALRQRLAIHNLRSKDTIESSRFLFELIQGNPVIVKNHGSFKLKNNPRISFFVCELEGKDGKSISNVVGQSKFNFITKLDAGSIKSPPSDTASQYKLVHYADKVPFHLPPFGFFEIKPTLVIGPSVIWAHVMHPHIATLNRLQDDLNARYQPTKSSSHAPVQGEICVAKFSQDQRYYRAEVLCVNHNGTVEVQYVDFGNIDTVMTSQLRDIDPIFLTLPKQALQFSISGIAPAVQSLTWSENAVAFVKDKISNRRVRVRIVSQTTKCYSVDLIDPDSPTEQLLNTLMVTHGHARPVDDSVDLPRVPTPSGSLVGVSIGRKTPNTGESPRAKFGKLTSGPRTPPSLCDSGRSTPSSEDGTSSQLHQAPHKFGSLSSPTSLVLPLKLPTEVCRENKGKPTSFPASVNRSSNHENQLVTPNKPVASSPSTLPGEFRWKSPGNTRAGLLPSPSDPKQQTVKTGSSILRPLLPSPSNTTANLPSPNVSASREKHHYSSKRLIASVKLQVDQSFQVIVSHVVHPLSFWIQLADEAALKQRLHLLNLLNQERLTPIASPHAGELCLCRSSSNNKVNRGRVMELSNSHATVEFIDYGNKETIELDRVFEIDSEMIEMPSQAVLCTLNNLLNPNGKGNPWDPEAIEFFKSKVCTESPVVVKCVKIVGMMNIVTLTLATGEDMLQVMDNSGHGKAFRDYKKSNERNQSQSKSPKNNRSPLKGGTVGDGGDSRRTPNQKKTSPFARPGGAQNVRGNANINKRSPFSPSNSVLREPESPPHKIVDSSRDSDATSLSPLKERSPLRNATKLPQTFTSNSAPSEYLLVDDMKKVEVPKCLQVLVSEVCSPESIFFQTATQQTATILNDLSTNLNTHFLNSSPPAIAQPPKKGSLVCAKFSQDGAWYRGEVLESHQSACKVRFIDYGNTDTVQLSDMSPCPSQFVSIPVQAVECSLNGIVPAGNSGQWSTQATSFVKEKCADVILQASIVSIRDSDGALLVELVNNSDGREANIAQDMVRQGLALNKQLEPGPTTLPGVSFKHQANSPVQFIQASSLQKADIPSSSAPFQVLVSEVHSPESIFFQTATQQTASILNDLSTNLNTHFLNSSPPAIAQPPKKGSLVCAKFSQDGAWYRGEVLESHQSACKVRFIDYGNTDTVQLSDMSPCPSQFVSIPVQAVECSLNGIVPAGNSGQWSTQATSFVKEKCADVILQASIVSIRDSDGALLVELVNNSDGREASIAQEMVSQGLASKKQPDVRPKQPVQPVSPQIQQLVQVSKLIGVEYPSMQPFQVFVSEVHSPESIFFQTATQQTAITLNDLSTNLNTHFQNSPPLPIAQPPKKGSLVCAKFSQDGAWYRGEVLETCEGVSKVRFIDYGNIDSVQLSDMSPCPSQFVSIPVQAVECALNGVFPLSGSPWAADSKATLLLKKLCQDSMLQANIVSPKASNQLLVDLCANVNGVEINIAPELIKKGLAKSSKQPPPQEPTLEVSMVKLPTCTPVKVNVSDCSSPSSIWLQLADRAKAVALNNMMTELQEVYTNPSKYAGVVPVVGKVCCCKYANDDCWYRCRVTRVSGKKVSVVYIDFGNSAVLSPNQLFSLDANFASLPCQAVECALSGVKPATQSGWTRECSEKLRSLLGTMQFRTAIVEESSSRDSKSKPSIKLYLDDNCTQSVADILIDSGHASPINAPPSSHASSPPVRRTTTVENLTPDQESTSRRSGQLPIPLPFVSLPTTARFPVILSQVTTLAEIYFQVATREALEVQLKMMKELSSYGSTAPPYNQLPAVGELCVAQYSDDNWFRAQVTRCLDNKTQCEVFFFDFGNNEVVDVGKLKPISNQLLQWPIQAIKCGMYGVPAQEALKPMTSDDLFLFQSLQASADVQQCIVVNKDPLLVDFESTGGLSVRDEYVRRGQFPQVSDLGKTSLRRTKLSTTSTEMVIVTEKVNGPSDFWVQVVDQTAMKEFEKLTEQIQEHCLRSPPLDQPPVLGQLCCARFSQDGMWYRAQVVEMLGRNTVRVLFVDFGNAEKTVVSDLRPANHVFTLFPAQAVHSCLVGHDVCKGASEKEKFSSLVNEKILIAANRGTRGLYKTVVELVDTSTSQDVYIHKQLQ